MAKWQVINEFSGRCVTAALNITKVDFVTTVFRSCQRRWYIINSISAGWEFDWTSLWLILTLTKAFSQHQNVINAYVMWLHISGDDFPASTRPLAGVLLTESWRNYINARSSFASANSQTLNQTDMYKYDVFDAPCFSMQHTCNTQDVNRARSVTCRIVVLSRKRR